MRLARRVNAAAAILLATLIACAPFGHPRGVNAATVKKADDTTVTGALIALENGSTIVLNVDVAGKPPQRTPIALEDVVEITIDAAKDIPPAAPAANNANAPAPVPTPPVAAPAKPQSIFDGKTLNGWQGDPAIWSVKEGAIVGTSDTPVAEGPEKTAYLILNEDVDDFELRFRYKLTGGLQNSSGVMFRAEVVEGPDNHKEVFGLQMDMGWPPGLTGGFLDTSKVEGRQRTRARPGSRVTFGASGDRQEATLDKGQPALAEVLKNEDWNDVILAVKGNRMVSVINGDVFAEMIDEQPASPKKGKLALQFGRRAALTIEFADIKFRKLGPADVPETPGVKWEVPAGAGAAAATTAAPAAAVPATQPAAAAVKDPPGLAAIFDGKTLKGWSGENDVWSVKDGVITGTVTDNTLSDKVTYLIYQPEAGGAEMGDFELHYKFKIVGGMRNSSGVQFRSRIVENDGHKDVNGYQQDLGGLPGLNGGFVDSLMSAGTTNVKAAPGERAAYDAEGTRLPSSLGKSADALSALVKQDDWNEATLIVQGNHFVSMINGEIFAEVINDHPNGAKAGVIAFQLSRRRVVTAQFKDIKLRKLGASDKPEVRGLVWDRVKAEADAARAKAAEAVANAGLAAPGAPAAPAAAPAAAPNAAAAPAPAPAAAVANAGPRPSAWQVRLIGGDRISGELVSWDERAVKLKTPQGELAVPVKEIREVWRAHDDEINRARTAAASSGAAATDDVAFARKDAQVLAVAGRALATDGGSLRFRYRDKEEKINLDKLVGVTLAAAQDVVPDETLQQSLVLGGPAGSVVSGKWTALDQGVVTLTTSWGAALKVPLRDVSTIRTKNGRLVYLSDLQPAQVEQVPYFDRMLPYRIDKSLTGTPIKFSDGEHPRGISVHSRTVLRYDVARRFEKFRAKVGFQQPEGKLGRATIRVLGDADKVLHEIPDARGDAPPVDLDIPIAGVSRLTLEVDFGADQDVADRVAWANARLLRAPKAGGAAPAAAAAAAK